MRHFVPLCANRAAEPKRVLQGYTLGLKTAISVPDDVFKEAEELARRLKKSRSELYSLALAEYIVRHSPERATKALDRVCSDLGQEDEFPVAAARRILESSEW